MFVDSHAHLADSAFDADRDEVIARARASGAAGIVCIGESIAAAERARDVARGSPGFISFTAGIHPHDAAGFDAHTHLPAIRALLEQGAVAVGECGLDYHYDNSPREAQREAFAAQIALAAELERPVVVHTREAVDDTRAMIREAQAAGVRGVLHCFTGPVDLAERALDSGWFVSFAGIVTFKRWSDDSLLRAIPDERLLVESDAPYLAPVPYRGRRNEPAYTTLTVDRLARVRNVDPDALAARVGENARQFYGLASAPR